MDTCTDNSAAARLQTSDFTPAEQKFFRAAVVQFKTHADLGAIHPYRAYMMMAHILGQQAANLVLQGPAGVTVEEARGFLERTGAEWFDKGFDTAMQILPRHMAGQA